MQFVMEEDVKFIRLAFCDVFGKAKNKSIMPSELERAFSQGIAIDASAITGFGGEVNSDLFLHPDPDTLAILPWRPEHGKVVRMYCTITRPDGNVFENDTRSILIHAVARNQKRLVLFNICRRININGATVQSFGLCITCKRFCRTNQCQHGGKEKFGQVCRQQIPEGIHAGSEACLSGCQ